MKVLVVEDDLGSRRLISSIIGSYCEIEEASDGDEAVQAYCLAVADNKPFDCILLDLTLPTISGLDALAQIRDLEEQNSIALDQGVKVLIMSASKELEDVFNAEVLGCRSYLLKPLDKSKVISSLKQVGIIPEETGN